MKALFSINKNALKENNFGPTANVWKRLGDDLNKRPKYIYDHWRCYIHPTLVRYEAGVVMDANFRETLINYLVDNNIMYVQEAIWEQIAEDPIFHGTTSYYLSSVYKSVFNNTMNKFHVAKSDITTLMMQTNRSQIRDT